MARFICELKDHTDDVNCCSFSDSYVATCSLDKTIRVYSLKDFKELPFSPLKGHTYAVHWCCFAPDKPILASCSTDGKTILWSMHNGQMLAVLEQPSGSPVRVCRYSSISNYLATGGSDGSIVLWNVQQMKFHRSATVKDGSIVACAFSPHGNLLITGSSCGDLTAWDESLKCLYNEKGHDLGVTCCDFSSQTLTEHGIEYYQMASCGQDNEIRVWLISFSDARGFDMRCQLTLGGHSSPVLSCSFSSDGQLLVSGSVDKSVIIYTVKTGCILHILTHHTRYVTSCALAPKHPLLATGSMDKTATIWKLGHSEDIPDFTAESRMQMDVETWSEEKVATWLSQEGLNEVEHIFKANNIDGKELLHLTKDNLLNDLKIESLGLRNKLVRRIQDLKGSAKAELSNIPNEFLCPITWELMTDPVIASDGYSYERKAIEDWISRKKRTSPMTNLPLENLLLTPNRTLKMALNRWLERQNHREAKQMTLHR
ncbi:WD repeat, SAM and U-box domain-containing protein 1 [Xenopus laevis]|uniref:WD repeat, SAM and U-box domain-containing protein 1 n=1 Tax=Xenopus laevis TaxID=8355 RepID=A0A8J1LVF5_XENLA|nr:WD repeat, SAM and U-box domain-containing protein 1 [Xenopus laevis]